MFLSLDSSISPHFLSTFAKKQMLGHLGERDSKINPMSAIRMKVTVTSYCHIAKALYTLLRPIDVRENGAQIHKHNNYLMAFSSSLVNTTMGRGKN